MSWAGSTYFFSHTLHAGFAGLSPGKCVKEKIRRDPSRFDSNDSLTPLSNGAQLWLGNGGEWYCDVTTGLRWIRAKARTQTLDG